MFGLGLGLELEKNSCALITVVMFRGMSSSGDYLPG